nr:uncharacterized protein LOC105472536 [Macaca nemestrina]
MRPEVRCWVGKGPSQHPKAVQRDLVCLLEFRKWLRKCRHTPLSQLQAPDPPFPYLEARKREEEAGLDQDQAREAGVARGCRCLNPGLRRALLRTWLSHACCEPSHCCGWSGSCCLLLATGSVLDVAWCIVGSGGRGGPRPWRATGSVLERGLVCCGSRWERRPMALEGGLRKLHPMILDQERARVWRADGLLQGWPACPPGRRFLGEAGEAPKPTLWLPGTQRVPNQLPCLQSGSISSRGLGRFGARGGTCPPIPRRPAHRLNRTGARWRSRKGKPGRWFLGQRGGGRTQSGRQAVLDAGGGSGDGRPLLTLWAGRLGGPPISI